MKCVADSEAVKSLVSHAESHGNALTACVLAFLIVVDTISYNLDARIETFIDCGILDILDRILSSYRFVKWYPGVLKILPEFIDSGPIVLQKLVEHNIIHTLFARVTDSCEAVAAKARLSLIKFFRNAEREHIYTGIMKGLADTLSKLLFIPDSEAVIFAETLTLNLLKKNSLCPTVQTAKVIHKSALLIYLELLANHEQRLIAELARECLRYFPSLDGNGFSGPVNCDGVYDDNPLSAWFETECREPTDNEMSG